MAFLISFIWIIWSKNLLHLSFYGTFYVIYLPQTTVSLWKSLCSLFLEFRSPDRKKILLWVNYLCALKPSACQDVGSNKCQSLLLFFFYTECIYWFIFVFHCKSRCVHARAGSRLGNKCAQARASARVEVTSSKRAPLQIWAQHCASCLRFLCVCVCVCVSWKLENGREGEKKTVYNWCFPMEEPLLPAAEANPQVGKIF